MVIVDSARRVVGGVDTHRDVNVAAVVDMNGGLLGVESFTTSSLSSITNDHRHAISAVDDGPILSAVADRNAPLLCR